MGTVGMGGTLELGVAAIIVILILREVLPFLKNNGSNRVCRALDSLDKKVTTIEDVTDKTWAIHDKYDASGVPLWYTHAPEWRGGLKEMTRTLSEIHSNQKEITRTQREIVEILDKIKTEAREHDKATNGGR